MNVARLADERHGGRPRIEQGAQVGVGRGVAAGPPRGAEGHEAGVLEVERLSADEKLGVLRVAARPTALDEVHAEFIELARDLQLVLDGERHAFHLGAVAQGGVVEL